MHVFNVHADTMKIGEVGILNHLHNCLTFSNLGSAAAYQGGAGRRRTRPAAGEPGADPGDTPIPRAGGAFNNRMTAESLRVRADITCVT